MLTLQEAVSYTHLDFEAWPFGPVIPEVYYRYCGFGALGICIKYDVDMDSDYAAIINPIIERKRMMNSWDWSKDINISGKAWNQVYDLSLRHIFERRMLSVKTVFFRHHEEGVQWIISL